MSRRKYITDNRKFDSFDKIKSYYIDGTKLSGKQEKKRLQYEQAHQLRLNGYSKEQTVRLLQEKNVVASVAEAYRVCNNAEMLYGDVAASNKDGLRVILTENFFKLYQMAIKAQDIKEANRALENMAKINSLYKEEDLINWNQIIIPVPVYSTNPKALIKDHEIDEAEIIIAD